MMESDEGCEEQRQSRRLFCHGQENGRLYKGNGRRGENKRKHGDQDGYVEPPSGKVAEDQKVRRRLRDLTDYEMSVIEDMRNANTNKQNVIGNDGDESSVYYCGGRKNGTDFEETSNSDCAMWGRKRQILPHRSKITRHRSNMALAEDDSKHTLNLDQDFVSATNESYDASAEESEAVKEPLKSDKHKHRKCHQEKESDPVCRGHRGKIQEGLRKNIEKARGVVRDCERAAELGAGNAYTSLISSRRRNWRDVDMEVNEDDTPLSLPWGKCAIQGVDLCHQTFKESQPPFHTPRPEDIIQNDIISPMLGKSYLQNRIDTGNHTTSTKEISQELDHFKGESKNDETVITSNRAESQLSLSGDETGSDRNMSHVNISGNTIPVSQNINAKSLQKNLLCTKSSKDRGLFNRESRTGEDLVQSDAFSDSIYSEHSIEECGQYKNAYLARDKSQYASRKRVESEANWRPRHLMAKSKRTRRIRRKVLEKHGKKKGIKKEHVEPSSDHVISSAHGQDNFVKVRSPRKEMDDLEDCPWVPDCRRDHLLRIVKGTHYDDSFCGSDGSAKDGHLTTTLDSDLGKVPRKNALLGEIRRHRHNSLQSDRAESADDEETSAMDVMSHRSKDFHHGGSCDYPKIVRGPEKSRHRRRKSSDKRSQKVCQEENDDETDCIEKTTVPNKTAARPSHGCQYNKNNKQKTHLSKQKQSMEGSNSFSRDQAVLVQTFTPCSIHSERNKNDNDDVTLIHPPPPRECSFSPQAQKEKHQARSKKKGKQREDLESPRRQKEECHKRKLLKKKDSAQQTIKPKVKVKTIRTQEPSKPGLLAFLLDTSKFFKPLFASYRLGGVPESKSSTSSSSSAGDKRIRNVEKFPQKQTANDSDISDSLIEVSAKSAPSSDIPVPQKTKEHAVPLIEDAVKESDKGKVRRASVKPQDGIRYSPLDLTGETSYMAYRLGRQQYEMQSTVHEQKFEVNVVSLPGTDRHEKLTEPDGGHQNSYQKLKSRYGKIRRDSKYLNPFDKIKGRTRYAQFPHPSKRKTLELMNSSSEECDNESLDVTNTTEVSNGTANFTKDKVRTKKGLPGRNVQCINSESDNEAKDETPRTKLSYRKVPKTSRKHPRGKHKIPVLNLSRPKSHGNDTRIGLVEEGEEEDSVMGLYHDDRDLLKAPRKKDYHGQNSGSRHIKKSQQGGNHQHECQVDEDSDDVNANLDVSLENLFAALDKAEQQLKVAEENMKKQQRKGNIYRLLGKVSAEKKTNSSCDVRKNPSPQTDPRSLVPRPGKSPGMQYVDNFLPASKSRSQVLDIISKMRKNGSKYTQSWESETPSAFSKASEKHKKIYRRKRNPSCEISNQTDPSLDKETQSNHPQISANTRRSVSESPIRTDTSDISRRDRKVRKKYSQRKRGEALPKCKSQMKSQRISGSAFTRPTRGTSTITDLSEETLSHIPYIFTKSGLKRSHSRPGFQDTKDMASTNGIIENVESPKAEHCAFVTFHSSTPLTEKSPVASFDFSPLDTPIVSSLSSTRKSHFEDRNQDSNELIQKPFANINSCTVDLAMDNKRNEFGAEVKQGKRMHNKSYSNMSGTDTSKADARIFSEQAPDSVNSGTQTSCSKDAKLFTSKVTKEAKDYFPKSNVYEIAMMETDISSESDSDTDTKSKVSRRTNPDTEKDQKPNRGLQQQQKTPKNIKVKTHSESGYHSHSSSAVVEVNDAYTTQRKSNDIYGPLTVTEGSGDHKQDEASERIRVMGMFEDFVEVRPPYLLEECSRKALLTGDDRNDDMAILHAMPGPYGIRVFSGKDSSCRDTAVSRFNTSSTTGSHGLHERGKIRSRETKGMLPEMTSEEYKKSSGIQLDKAWKYTRYSRMDIDDEENDYNGNEEEREEEEEGGNEEAYDDADKNVDSESEDDELDDIDDEDDDDDYDDNDNDEEEIEDEKMLESMSTGSSCSRAYSLEENDCQRYGRNLPLDDKFDFVSDCGTNRKVDAEEAHPIAFVNFGHGNEIQESDLLERGVARREADETGDQMEDEEYYDQTNSDGYEDDNEEEGGSLLDGGEKIEVGCHFLGRDEGGKACAHNYTLLGDDDDIGDDDDDGGGDDDDDDDDYDDDDDDDDDDNAEKCAEIYLEREDVKVNDIEEADGENENDEEDEEKNNENDDDDCEVGKRVHR